MKSGRFGVVAFLAALFSLLVSMPAHAQSGNIEYSDTLSSPVLNGNSYLNLMVGLRKYFNSFTSWQLPANSGPQDPISRLEYPWDQTFLAIRGSARYTTLEVNMEWSGTLNLLSNPKAQDSDWTDPNNTNQKTIFSEAEANPRSWIMDLSCNMPIPGFSALNGVLGYRLSQFKFTNSDGYQYSIYNDGTDTYEYSSLPLPGAVIEFSQYYKQLYGGGIMKSSLDLREISSGLRLPALLLRLQADASYVIGDSHDQHLLRYAFGIIRSTGFGWHVNLTAGFNSGRFRFDLEGDMRGIQTSGEIQSIQENMYVPGLIQDFFVDGAKAWSEQKYIGVNGTIFF